MSRGLAAASRREEEVSDARPRRPSCTCKCIPTGRQSDTLPAPPPHTAPGQQFTLYGLRTLGWVGLGPGVEGGLIDYLTIHAGDSACGRNYSLLAPLTLCMHHQPQSHHHRQHFRVSLSFSSSSHASFRPFLLPQPFEPVQRCLPAVPSAAWAPSWRNAHPPPWLPPSTYVSDVPYLYCILLSRPCTPVGAMLACPQSHVGLPCPPSLPPSLHLTPLLPHATCTHIYTSPHRPYALPLPRRVLLDSPPSRSHRI